MTFPMESSPSSIEQYRADRARIYSELERIRDEIDAWLDSGHEEAPVPAELARIQRLHEDRTRLIAELQASEDRAVGSLGQAAASATSAPEVVAAEAASEPPAVPDAGPVALDGLLSLWQVDQ